MASLNIDCVSPANRVAAPGSHSTANDRCIDTALGWEVAPLLRMQRYDEESISEIEDQPLDLLVPTAILHEIECVIDGIADPR